MKSRITYGLYQENKVVEVNRNRFPPHFDLQIGTVLRIRKAGGEKIRRVVTTLSDTKVTLDANHPLAGEDLTFVAIIPIKIKSEF